MKYKSVSIFTVLLSVTLFSCQKPAPIPEEVTITNDDLAVSLTIHTDKQKELLESSDPASLISSNKSQYGNVSNSKPAPISFSWSEENELNQKADRYNLSISESADMSNSIVFTTNTTSIDVYSLKINTKYYYRVSSIHSSKSFDGDIGEFTINDVAPRNIYVDGVENVRDLGGWNIGTNRKYKQGLIYRCAQFNNTSSSFDSAITQKGLETTKNELKIKTDIDLRLTNDFDVISGKDETGGITSSPLGSGVNYVATPMYNAVPASYKNKNIFTYSYNKPSIKTFFETLADSSNYPLMFHCIRGTDRTGAMAYALGALLGMNKDDLLLDYLFSDLAKIGTPIEASTISGQYQYVSEIDNMSDSTLSEKARSYLKEVIGLSDTTLDSVINILVDEL